MAVPVLSAEQLQNERIQVTLPSGAEKTIRPVLVLKNPIKRYLPPAGPYYDQSALDAAKKFFNETTKCICCWNPKAQKKCACLQKCTVCGTREHVGVECPKLYAGLWWWRACKHDLPRKRRVRPTPGERAYLVIAGVFKDWNEMDEPVVVNMDHPLVNQHYKGKKAPQAMSFQGKGLYSMIAAESSGLPLTFEPNAKVTGSAIQCDTEADTTLNPISVQMQNITKTDQVRPAASEKNNAVRDVFHQESYESLSAKDDSAFDRSLKRTWQPPICHEGIKRARITPLSIRLALYTARQFTKAQQTATSSGNDLDPRLKARARPEHTSGAAKSPYPVSSGVNPYKPMQNKEEEYTRSRKELEEAREEIRMKDRRIRELELALHETEGWTETVTYRAGEKRPRG